MINLNVWQTEDGRSIQVTELEDNHLLNIFRMLDCQLKEIAEATMFFLHPFFGPSPGSMAEECVERGMAQDYKHEVWALAWLGAIGDEIERRGLQLPNRSKPKPPPKIEHVEAVEHGGRVIGHIAKLAKG